MVLPALGLLLRGAVSAAARSGAAGRGAGGIARISKVSGEYGKAKAAYAAEAAKGLGPTKDLAKAQEGAKHAMENFQASLGVNVPEIVKSIKEWRAALVESGKALVNYSSSIAKAYQELAIGDQQRKLKTAKGTAGTTADLARAENRLRDATQPFEQLSTNVQNRMATLLTEVTATVVEVLNPIAESLDKLVQKEEGKTSGNIPGLDPFAQAAARHDARRRKPIDGF